MNKYLPILIFTIIFMSCIENNNRGIKIEWINGLEGDFSFIEKWDYPEGIYRNEYGQLICDGICSPEIDRMRDADGKIMDDSLHRYYQYVDTTHMYSTESESNSPEWAGANYAEASIYSDKTVICHTMCNASTHSSLVLKISGNSCSPYIDLLSITKTEPEFFRCKGGYIKIDKPLFEEGILKAEFSFDFIHPDNTPLWWKGKILTKID